MKTKQKVGEKVITQTQIEMDRLFYRKLCFCKCFSCHEIARLLRDKNKSLASSEVSV